MGKKALALEGGSLRCLFSAGVTDLMMEKGLVWDGVIGVSAGALKHRRGAEGTHGGGEPGVCERPAVYGLQEPC